jgi:iron complex transport system substrate-binding protein
MPSNTEIVEALGAGDELVGVTSYDSFPTGSRRANIGDLLNPQWEVLLSLKPHIVLAGQWTGSSAVARLKTLKIPVLEVPHAETLPGLYDSIRHIARAIRHEDTAEAVISRMQRQLLELEKQNATRPWQTLYIEIDPPNWTLGAKDVLNDGLRVLRLHNIFVSVPRRATQVSLESVVDKNPDVILIFQARAADVARRPGWARIKAVRQGMVFDDVSADDLVRPSPRLVRGLERLNERLSTAREK